jgi:hypothetical protein
MSEEKKAPTSKKRLAGIVTLSVIAILGLASCVSGIGVGDLVVSRTPAELQQPQYVDGVDDVTGEAVRVKISDGLPETLTHNESEREFEIWKERQLRTGERWKANLEDSGRWVGFVNSFTELAYNIGMQQLEGLGLMGIAGAGLLGMLGFRRPKDSSPEQVDAKLAEQDARWQEVLRHDKEASYNEGQKVAADTYKAVLEALKKQGVDVPDVLPAELPQEDKA